MVIITHFASQIIPLAVGFGMSYWLFITAYKFEGQLKSIGETFGWMLIVLTLLSSLFSFLYSIKLMNDEYMREGSPVIRFIQPQVQNEPIDDSGNSSNVNDAGNTGINEQLHETNTPGEGKPVTETGKDQY